MGKQLRLSRQREKFCREVAGGKQPRQAALLAGYKRQDTAEQLMRQAEIQKRIDSIQNEMRQLPRCQAEESENDQNVADEIVGFLAETMREGDADLRVRIKAAELLSRQLPKSGEQTYGKVIIVDDITEDIFPSEGQEKK